MDEIYALLQSILENRDTASWLDLLKDADIPAAAVNSIHDVLADEHLNKIGFFRRVRHPSEGEIILLDSPFEWSE
ncbi:CoA transferase, partial [Klebsiella pneumoniae]|uniref:CoA transferase n=1 Tax=Klebsiella pneumoniae TaxID=573 RepID=UPI001EF8494F